MMKRVFIMCLVISALYGTTYGQYSLCGSVAIDNIRQENAVVTIIGSGDTVMTSARGNFCFAGLSSGEYLVQATYKNFVSHVESVLLNDDVIGLDLHILPITLDEVTVTGLTRAGERRLHSIKTEIIDLNKEARSSVSVENLMNRTAGIRIRNSGGLGAQADVVVGGFNGKSVKFLIDGIPIDYLGTSMGITKIPAEIADYIEIYKGVMPTEVAIDALGGAINIVSKKPIKTNHRFSYEIGSYNTHRGSINSYIRLSERFSYGVNAFVNYTRNDFEVDGLPIVEEETGRTRFITARLFHNGYKQISGEAFVNFEKRKWADLFRIKVNSYGLKREIQNDFTSRSKAYGDVYAREYAYVVPSAYYEKSFLSDRLNVSQFLVFSRINNELVDSAKNVYYDWLGKRHEMVSGTEMGLDLSNLDKPAIKTRLNNITYRGLFSYAINKEHELILNVVNNYFTREADDLHKYHAKTYLKYNRFIANLGYEYHLFSKSFVGLSQVKYLNSQTIGQLYNDYTGRYDVPVQNNGLSMAQSVKYNLLTNWLIRASIENTFRLPDQMEIFGDNNFILSNISLKPERSINVNLGFRYKPSRDYSLEVNGYMRNVKDLIRLKDLTQFQSIFLNLDKVRGYGLELEGSARFFTHLTISGNLTYNDFRFKGSNSTIANNDHFINARVSNMPFYFGNAMASYRLESMFSEQDELQLYWSYSYVHQFYLDFIERQYEPDGFLGLYGKSKVYTNRVIPIQQIHSVGFVWNLKCDNKNIFSLSAELNNIFDAAIYNTFKMQSAGRSVSVKFSYEF